MLTLTRKPGEIVDICVDGRTIEVTVVQVKGNQVGLNFKADRDISINRREITDKIEAKNAMATQAETKDGE